MKHNISTYLVDPQKKTPRGNDAFGGSYQLVRTKYPLMRPKRSPSFSNMTRLTAVQDRSENADARCYGFERDVPEALSIFRYVWRSSPHVLQV